VERPWVQPPRARAAARRCRGRGPWLAGRRGGARALTGRRRVHREGDRINRLRSSRRRARHERAPMARAAVRWPGRSAPAPGAGRRARRTGPRFGGRGLDAGHHGARSLGLPRARCAVRPMPDSRGLWVTRAAEPRAGPAPARPRRFGPPAPWGSDTCARGCPRPSRFGGAFASEGRASGGRHRRSVAAGRRRSRARRRELVLGTATIDR
jgi:hypothetical protein